MRRLISATVLAIGLATTGAALAAPASAAALSPCNTTVIYVDQNGELAPDYQTTVPYRSGVNGSCNVVQGASGAQVRAIQSALDSCYGESLTVDGVYGAQTRAAVLRTQAKIGATQDGAYGPETGSKMKWYATYHTSSGAIAHVCRVFSRNYWY